MTKQEKIYSLYFSLPIYKTCYKLANSIMCLINSHNCLSFYKNSHTEDIFYNKFVQYLANNEVSPYTNPLLHAL